MGKQQNNVKHPDDAVVVDRVHYWSAGALRQGERLLALIDSQTKYGCTPTEWTPEQRREIVAANDLGGGHFVEELEGDFFVFAVHQVRVWLAKARTRGALSTTVIDRFEAGTLHAKDLRDMTAHEDEYLAGAGKRQDRYINGSAPAHSIVVGGADDYSIGGRLSVPKVALLLRELVAAVEAVRRSAPGQ